MSARTSRPRVALLTEGTYPFVVGGVSTWCHQVVTGLPEFDFELVAVTSPELEEAVFRLPPNARVGAHLQLWGPRAPRRAPGAPRAPRARRPQLGAELLRGLLGWDVDPLDVVPALVWCRQHPERVVPTFRAAATWTAFLAALEELAAEHHPDAGEVPPLDVRHALELYATTSWLARTAAEATPDADVSLVTAAGWAVLPAVVDKALTGRPVLLSEHGVYVREAYLAAARSSDGPAQRFTATRLARGLARLTYAVADVVSPVTAANAAWEERLGAAPGRIVPVPNGVPAPGEPAPAPRTCTVVSVGRIDPLKDVATMLRVAAEVRRRVPGARFLHYGPVPPGQEAYARGCRELHAALGLEGAFEFRGSTSDPTGVVRDADVVLMTSISEGFPMAVLEALSQARPVVTTHVGGVLEAVLGAGVTAAPGDVAGLADAVSTLLRDPELAERLGRRGHARVRRNFPQQRCLDGYRLLLGELVGARAAVPVPAAAAGPRELVGAGATGGAS
ncbi:DUF3492 domain-containing protein [Kineococcus terrestris]|uniref:DUF3492 domain-containing protein n=1 Tax=Kineococcus terrestris TaxID=2044856 RepID=UPI0034DB324D